MGAPNQTSCSIFLVQTKNDEKQTKYLRIYLTYPIFALYIDRKNRSSNICRNQG